VAKQVVMPRLSQAMETGQVVKWFRREGDQVTEGDPLLVVESEKAEVEISAPVSGVVRHVLVAAGTEAPVGQVLAILGDPGGSLEALADAPAEPSAPPSLVGPEQENRGSGRGSRSGSGRGSRKGAARASGAGSAVRRVAAPSARRVAAELGVDLADVLGTGLDGLVTERDVRAYAASRQSPAADYEVVPLSGIRRRIAERMALSKQTAADVTTVVDVDMTAVAEMRRAGGPSYTSFVVWAAALGLREFPILNSSLVGAEIHVHRRIDVGVAVAAEQGLVVPVVRRADDKTPATISAEIDQLRDAARVSALGPGLVGGSTFSVTNSGAFGSLMFTPIINPPEVAILGMGKVADTPVVRDGEVRIRKVMYLCLTYDHRVVDGEPAVRFLQAVKARLEHADIDPSARSADGA